MQNHFYYFIKHNSPDLMVRLYKSLVRPHLEYSSPVWNPHYRKDKLLSERVQHRFTMLFEDLKNLPLWSLEERRNRAGYRAIRQLTNSVTRRFGDKAGRFGERLG